MYFYLAAFCILLSVAMLLLLYRSAQMERKRRFAGRRILSFDEWCNRFFPDREIDRVATRTLLECLSAEVGVEPTQIHPSDSIARDLTFGKWYLLEDSLDAATEQLGRYLRGRSPDEWPPSLTGETVGELIICISIFLQKRRCPQGKDGTRREFFE
jgi:hypothetical protein